MNKQLPTGSNAWIHIPGLAPTLPEALRFEELPTGQAGVLFFQLWGLGEDSCHLVFPNKINQGQGVRLGGFPGAGLSFH